MRRALVIVFLLLAACAAAGYFWWRAHRPKSAAELVLYGNVDLRQVDLAFNNSERISSVGFQEGDRVKRGQVVAHLDTGRLEPQVAQAKAQLEGQRQALLKLRNGSRPEEIAQARANLQSAQADAANVRLHHERLKTLFDASAGRSVVRQDVDNAKALVDVNDAKVVVNQKALDLAVIGPRKEDIDQAQAQLDAQEAQLALLLQQLADSQLIAPTDAVVRSRLMEPGEMATPAKPVFSLAITDPKWVRAYVTETDLGKVHHGFTATVAVDAFPGKRFDGWVGFISPMAEFTPKSVQTEELRTSLVYEVRVFVQDPGDDLRLGMPATVYIPLKQKQGQSPASSPAPAVTTAATAATAPATREGSP